MPALPAVPKVIRLAISGRQARALSVINRHYFEYSGSLSQADMNTFVGAALGFWTTRMAPLVSSDFAWTSAEAVDLSSSSAPVGTAATSVTGAVGTPALTVGTAAIVKYLIARRYRGGKPKVFIAGVLTADLSDDNTIKPASATAFAQAQLNYFADVAGGSPVAMGTVKHVSVSYFEGFTNVSGPTGRERARSTVRVTPIVDDVIGYQGVERVGSQRRRNA